MTACIPCTWQPLGAGLDFTDEIGIRHAGTWTPETVGELWYCRQMIVPARMYPQRLTRTLETIAYAQLGRARHPGVRWRRVWCLMPWDPYLTGEPPVEAVDPRTIEAGIPAARARCRLHAVVGPAHHERLAQVRAVEDGWTAFLAAMEAVCGVQAINRAYMLDLIVCGLLPAPPGVPADAEYWQLGVALGELLHRHTEMSHGGRRLLRAHTDRGVRWTVYGLVVP